MNEHTAVSFVPLEDGGRLAVSVAGAHDAAPLLLLRPLGGSMALWGDFAARLAGHFRVVSFDYRGIGESSAAPLRVTTQSLARNAVAVLNHLAIKRAHVFGISLGGMAATVLAAEAPGRVDRLSLASLPVRGRTLVGRDFRAAIRLSACFARRPSRVEPCLVQHVLSRDFQEKNPAETLRILTHVMRRPTSPATLLKSLGAAVGHDASALLGRIQAPTLVLAGGNDTLLGPEFVRPVAQGISGARFEVIDTAGHDLTLEDPRGTAERVAAFLTT